MDLISWSEGFHSGIGRSGTRYSIFVSGAARETELWCRIAVDGEEVCAVDSLEAAIGRIEHFEALRCFLNGMESDLSARQLRQAEAVAAEMADAAQVSLESPSLPPNDRLAIEESVEALRSICRRIRVRRAIGAVTMDGAATIH